MPDISDLQLPDEPVPEIDYAAPDTGAFPPMVKPGMYEFLFHLPESTSDQFDKVEIKPPTLAPGVYLQVNHEAEALRDSQGNAVPATSSGDQPKLRFQRVSTYKHPKMPNSSFGDLVRALGLHIDGPLTPTTIASTLRSIDGRSTYIGEVGWRSYCKSCDQTVSTHPRKKKGDAAWPRNAEGGYEEMVACPKCGQKSYGNSEIVRYKLPTRS